MDRNPLQWRWVNELGVHNAVDARELVDALLTGRMTPHVWVWRTGWTSWIRASQVTELATAIPKGARLPAVAIAIDPTAVEPPPIPRYSLRSQAYVRRTSTPVPAAMHLRTLVRRPAAPTLVETEIRESSVSQTLRPPGAVPPPPRTFSGAFAFDVQRALDLATFASDDTLPRLGETSPRLAELGHSRASLPGDASSSSEQHSVAQNLVPTTAPDLVMRSVLDAGNSNQSNPALASATADNDVSSRADLTEHFPRGRSGQYNRGRRIFLTGSIGLVAAVGSFGFLYNAGFLRKDVKPSVSASPSSSTTSRPAKPCRLLGAAERLAPSIALNVAPIVATSTDNKSLAVGFADTANSAAGIVVDPITRSVKYVFREAGTSRVTSVVPKVQGAQLSFAVARDKDTLKESRAVLGPPEFTFGQTVEGFARQLGSANPETIWPTDIDTPCTGPRLVSLPNLGHAVTFRQGGLTGSIQVGWLTTDGHSRIAPWSAQTAAKSLGQPNIAASGSRVMVTFAGRASDADPWAVHTLLVPPDGTGGPSQRLPQLPGGPGGDAIAPTAAGLGEGRFVLQWSEGATGHRLVRVQTLDAQLQPWGPTVNVSPADTNAGQGVLWVNGAYAVSLFVVNVGRSAELWATSLQCSE